MNAAPRAIARPPLLWRQFEPLLPPADGAHWRPAAHDASPLLYLAWGARRFGEVPIQRRKPEGWVFTLVVEGEPVIVCEHARERLAPGTLVVLGPDCAFGWHAANGHASRLLVWMWREMRHPALRQLARAALWRHPVPRAEVHELQQLHTATRAEAARGDAHSLAALAALQTLIETRIARLGERGGEDDVAVRALRWIETHLATRQPLARLADFLGVSTATVHRIFRERFGTSVRQKIAELRCREAERLLASAGVTVKEVAYQLGYRHPHDFSRAFRNCTGVLPTEQRTLAQARPADVPAVAA